MEIKLEGAEDMHHGNERILSGATKSCQKQAQTVSSDDGDISHIPENLLNTSQSKGHNKR
jgi:hypothetical protein